MSLENPKSEIRLFNVPWQPNDLNFLKFSSTSAQTSAFNSYFNGLDADDKYSGTDFDIITNGVIRLPVNQYKAMKFNYLMFHNTDLNSVRTWWYAFITRVEWSAYNTCNVYYTLDAWQNYQFNITFKKCFIERSHVPVSASGDWAGDVAGNYLAPEPVSVSPQVEREISDFTSTGGDSSESLDWTPTWVLHSTSKYDGNDYVYSGDGSGETLSAEYGRFVSSTSQIQDIIKNYGRKSPDQIAREVGSASGNQTWKDWVNAIFSGTAGQDALEAVKSTTSIADLQDHRNELIGLYAIPTWVKGNSSTWASNDIVHKQINLTLDQNTLAVQKNGTSYTPRNKKMLTSMCKGYSLYTRNGFKIALKPELFTTSSPTVGLYANQMGTDGFLIHIGDYRNSSDSWHRLNYSCQSRIGYDANTGLDKTLNQLSVAIGGIGTVANMVSDVSTSNWMGVLSDAGSVVGNARNMIDAIGQRGVNTGSSGNLISITGNRPVPRLVDVSPNWAECEYIDDYLDVYGYAIDEIKSVNITSRPSWNYMKVAKLNAKIDAPDEYASVIKNAFESGVHIWHTSISNVGNFGLSNR